MSGSAGAPLDAGGLLLDMDGVLTVSWRPLPGAVETVARLRAAGVPFRIMTNTTSRSHGAIATSLRAAGFDVADDEVLTASVAAAAYLRAHHAGARVFVLGDAVPDDLAGVRLVGLDGDPEVVVISGADRSFAFENLNRVHRVLLGGAAFVAMHRNLSWMTDEGECLDAGAYLLGLERAARREAAITGKPSPDFFRAGLEALRLPPERAAMVGDDVESDVLAAQAIGMAGVLVRTGKFREEALAAATGTPGHVVGSIADVPALLGLA